MAKVEIRRRNIAENFNRLSSAHDRYRRQTDRQTTDGRAIAYNVCSRSLKICYPTVKTFGESASCWQIIGKDTVAAFSGHG